MKRKSKQIKDLLEDLFLTSTKIRSLPEDSQERKDLAAKRAELKAKLEALET